MVQAAKNGARQSIKVPEFLKAQLDHAQARIGEIEGSAEKALQELMERGREGRKELTALIGRLSKDERVAELLGRLDKLQRTGADRAEAWKDRAESLRAEALERVLEVQQKAVSFLGVASRSEVESLHKELDRLAKRLDRAAGKKPARAAKARARTKRAEA
jgi:vacuolar-type H+-ATPase subunit I/STV1